MQSHFRSLVLAVLLLPSLGLAAERVERFSWAVGDHPIVKLEAFKGSIRVEPARHGQVELELRAKSNGERAEQWLQRLQVNAEPFGAGVSLAVRQEGLGIELGVGALPSRTVDMVLRVPRMCDLDLLSRDGVIEVANDFVGNVRVRIDQGEILVGRITGSVAAEAITGDIMVARTTGDLKARSRSGNLRVGTVMGWADLRADSGSIDIMQSHGGLDATSVSGDIVAGLAREMTHEVRLTASSGNVKVELDPEAALQVQARASFGSVRSSLPEGALQGRTSRGKVDGLLNGGGPLLALRASGGNVQINTVPSIDAYGF